MKTPEEYIKEAYKEKFPDIKWEDSTFTQFHYAAVFEHALKSMQEDAEKELVEYIQFSAWMEIGEEKLEWLMMTSQQRLTQFRNKQQHHDTTH